MIANENDTHTFTVGEENSDLRKDAVKELSLYLCNLLKVGLCCTVNCTFACE